MSHALVLDPGNTETAFVLFDLIQKTPLRWAKIPNREIFEVIRAAAVPVVSEFPYPRGQGVSWQTLATCREAGRFQRECEVLGLSWTEMDRADVKKHLCSGVKHPKDKDVRKALIDLFGGERCLAPEKCLTCKGKGGAGRGSAREVCAGCGGSGKNPSPGLLVNMSADCWQALGVAVTFANLGPSRSGAELQVERKAKRAQKEEARLLRIERFKKEIQELQEKGPVSDRQRLKDQLKITSLQKRLNKLDP